MKKAGRLAAAVFAAVLLVTGCGAPAEKKAAEATPAQSSKTEQKEEAKNLKDAFKEDFKVGVAVNPYQLKDEQTKKIILENFNSITMENGMKPEAILDQRASENSKDGMPAINEVPFTGKRQRAYASRSLPCLAQSDAGMVFL